eukprot:TRINITY_DN64199_c0_g1_i1.p1 TRINITY_DN64199_c0_g1~~TRINITY_DN64199_c0_g1_i1.p1  ORF type:complete len:215 (+),score=46.37 TRINITY_DN64199_c0_g1_i1:71-715(+)
MAAVIWLHGLGDVGESWMGAFSAVASQVPNVKFHHPTAPESPLTCDGGGKTTSWFDITTWRPPLRPIGLAEPDCPAGLDETVKFLHEKFEELEKQGVPAEKIVVGGFSQGGVSALAAGLSYPKKLGGIVSISGWATYRDSLATMISEPNKSLPVLYLAGTDDNVICSELSKKSGELFSSILGESATVVHTKRSMHQPARSEMSAANDFMIRCLA